MQATTEDIDNFWLVKFNLKNGENFKQKAMKERCVQTIANNM